MSSPRSTTPLTVHVDSSTVRLCHVMLLRLFQHAPGSSPVARCTDITATSDVMSLVGPWMTVTIAVTRAAAACGQRPPEPDLSPL